MHPRIDRFDEPMYTGIGSPKPDLKAVCPDTGNHIAFQQIGFRIRLDKGLIHLIVLTDTFFLRAKPNAVIVDCNRGDFAVYQAI